MDPDLIEPLLKLYCRFCIDYVDVAAVREVCFRMVESGNENDYLIAILASYPDEPRARMEELLAEALVGLGGNVPSSHEQRRILAEDIARQIVAGSIEPSVGADTIYWRYGNDDFGQLSSVYEYYESECEGDPDRFRRMAEINEEIVKEARKLVRRVE